MELPVRNSQAGAWELEKIAGSLDAMEWNRGIWKSVNPRLRFTSSRLQALATYEKNVLITMDITPAINNPSIHLFNFNSPSMRSNLASKRSSVSFNRWSSVRLDTNASCASAITRTTASACSCGMPAVLSLSTIKGIESNDGHLIKCQMNNLMPTR